jgi:hypothetical protein
MKIKPTDNECLKKILDEMDIPLKRKNDPFWLVENLAIRNKNHPDCEWAIALLKFMCLPENQ